MKWLHVANTSCVTSTTFEGNLGPCITVILESVSIFYVKQSCSYVCTCRHTQVQRVMEKLLLHHGQLRICIYFYVKQPRNYVRTCWHIQRFLNCLDLTPHLKIPFGSNSRYLLYQLGSIVCFVKCSLILELVKTLMEFFRKFDVNGGDGLTGSYPLHECQWCSQIN